ncbi:MAG: hypothetical protein ACYSUD_10170 [Planctomycetota bacterium]
MAKKKTGLQSEISSIFSGVPVPKKDRSKSPPASPAPKPAGSAPPRPKTPLPKTPPPKAPPPRATEPPAPRRPIEPTRGAPAPKVVEVKTPEQKIRSLPGRKSRPGKDKLFAPKAGASSARQRASIVMVLVLSILLVVVLARPFGASRRNPAGPGAAGQPTAGISAKTNAEIGWQRPDVYPAHLRDPMSLDSQGQPVIVKRSNWTVTGITTSEDRSIASIETQTMQDGRIVIQTETVEEGDTVLGATIVEISRSTVTFEKDGDTWKQEVRGNEQRAL